MPTAREVTRAMTVLAHAAGGDPYGVRSVDGAKAAYVRGDIDVDELERASTCSCAAEAGEVQVAVLEPGEQVISLRTGSAAYDRRTQAGVRSTHAP